MNMPRIVFMGTPDFATSILESLLDNNYNVVAVITAPDKPAGRGRKLNQSSVKKYAISKNIPVLQPKNLKNEDFLNELKSYHADLQIVVAFRMLPRVVWSMPALGTFNLHASLLPEYRGAAPIHWAIINGETKTGVSTFFIDDKIDTGEVILSKEVEINENETVGELHDKLMKVGADLVCRTVESIQQGTFVTKKQPEADTKPAPKLTSENTKIDWNQSVEVIYNKIRGLNPLPSAWTEIRNGEEIITSKIYGVDKSFESHNFKVGDMIADKKSLKIACKNGFIHIREIKLAGKKKMEIQSLLNGFQFHENAKAL